MNFVVELINELKNRLPENVEVMKNVSCISVENALFHNTPSIVFLLESFNKCREEIELMHNMWNKIIYWNEKIQQNA